jgi:hypothetical protein
MVVMVGAVLTAQSQDRLVGVLRHTHRDVLVLRLVHKIVHSYRLYSHQPVPVDQDVRFNMYLKFGSDNLQYLWQGQHRFPGVGACEP